jgi:cholesterol transport system auxiliary component
MIRTRGDGELRAAQEAATKGQEAVPRSIRIIRMAAVLVLMSLLSGCGATRPSKYYQLTVPADAATAAVEKPGAVPVTLLLGSFFTTHLYREDRIIYGNGAEEMGTYEYQRWAEPPAEMIEEVLLRELRASGRYRAVSVRRSNMKGDFAIRGRLYDFKEIDGRPIMGRVTLELEMRDLKSGATVWTHYYSHDEPVSNKDVPAVVAALDRNVQSGVKEFIASIDEYFASHPVK